LATYREIDVSIASGSPSSLRTTRRNFPAAPVFAAPSAAAAPSAPVAAECPASQDINKKSENKDLRDMGDFGELAGGTDRFATGSDPGSAA
jgi:hypothetical protein